MANIRLPKIGSIIQRDDGTFDVGPLPGLGGPFDDAVDYFQAWADKAQFPYPVGDIRAAMGPGRLTEQIVSSVQSFPDQLRKLASCLAPISDAKGPFPLYHTDFLHSNILVDDQYRTVGVIDWEGACTVPWELVELPLFLNMVPKVLDAPWNYGEDGRPIDEELVVLQGDRAWYVGLVKESEKECDTDDRLSRTLGDGDVQGLAYAMRAFLDPGKIAEYVKVLEPFRRLGG